MWLECVPAQLVLRDSQEKAFESIIHSLSRLQLKEDRAIAKQARLKAENDKLRRLACSKLIDFDDKNAESRLSELQADQSRLLRDASVVETALRQAADDLTRRTFELAATERLTAELLVEAGQLRREAGRLAQQRERTIDELASAQARLAVLAARERGLERENRQLLARWLSFSRRLAEQLNRRLEASELSAAVSGGGAALGVVGEVAWSPWTTRSCCQLLASTMADGPARVWTVEAGKLEPRWSADLGGGLRSVQFSPAGRLLAGATPDCVRLWSADEAGEIRPLRDTLDEPGAAAVRFIPTEPGRLATAGQIIRVWDVGEARSSAAPCLTVDCAAPCADLAAPGSEPATLAASHADGRIRLYDARLSASAGRALVLADCGWPVAGLAACPSQPCRLLAGLEAQLLLLDARVPGRPVADLCAEGLRLRPGSRCGLSQCGQLAVAGSVDGQLHVWHCGTSRLLDRRPLAARSSLLAAAWRPGAGQAGTHQLQVATCDRAGRVRVDPVELEYG